jgi:hydrogenase 3 maturation protease
MPDLRQQLEGSLGGCACLVGVGNVDLGDDGFGVRLAECVEEGLGRRETRACRLEARTTPAEGRLEPCTTPAEGRLEACTTSTDVVLAGVTPEAHLTALSDGRYDTVIFLDAVEFGGDPGAAVWLEADQMVVRCPQISTHKLSLGLLARLIEDGSRTRVRLLGVQPASLRVGTGLSAPVQTTLELLAGWILDVARGSGPTAGGLGRDGGYRREPSARFTSNFELRTSNFQHSTFNVQRPPSNFELRTSNFELRPSPLGLRPSPFGLRPSPFGLRHSPLGLRHSPLGLRPSPFGLPSAPPC